MRNEWGFRMSAETALETCDYKRWLKLHRWTEVQTACILSGTQPDTLTPAAEMMLQKMSVKRNDVPSLFRNINANREQLIKPLTAIHWAMDSKIDMPDGFLSALRELPASFGVIFELEDDLDYGQKKQCEYSHWLKNSMLSVDEFACILTGLEPGKLNAEAKQLRLKINAAIKAGVLKFESTNKEHSFIGKDAGIKWADENHIKLPDFLNESIEDGTLLLNHRIRIGSQKISASDSEINNNKGDCNSISLHENKVQWKDLNKWIEGEFVPEEQDADGKPRTAVGKLTIKAAEEIEASTQRRASAKDVMALLRKWAESGAEPEYLEAQGEEDSVIWMTDMSERKTYTFRACQTTLGRWRKAS